jgi:phage gp16-like protein
MSDYNRNRELAAIHVAKKQLGLDEETYRAMLINLTGQYSAAMLTAPQRRVVIEALRRKGFQAVNGGAETPQIRMIRGLWAELRKRGALRDPSDRALNHLCKRVTYVDRVEWLDQMGANNLVEALKAWLGRAGKGTTGEDI